MTENENLPERMDADIIYSQEIWARASYDEEQMAALFQLLLGKYGEEIDGFCDGLRVIQPYEDTARRAEAYRENVRLFLERMESFRDNGYSNEGLMEYYIKKEHRDVTQAVDFTAVRLALGMMERISPLEKEEIMQRLDGMEEICSKPLRRREKWEYLRGYLVWLSGKDIDIAMQILPLFFKIS